MKKIVKILCVIFFLIIVAVGLLVAFIVKDIWDKTTNVNKYEKYLGVEGKYKENFGIYNDIFPDTIPENVEVEDFCYIYYNPWDPCYLGYLVYACDAETFQEEYERLSNITSSEEIYIYGTTDFPYELCAVYTDDYTGYIYALADTENSRFIYVELQYCNFFNDIKYMEYIPNEYLPIGYDATMGNPYRTEMMRKLYEK